MAEYCCNAVSWRSYKATGSKRSTLNTSGEKPFGRDAVKQALVEAAIRLFSDRGVKASTIRDIADEANVNSALISRHFGGKEGLVDAVLVELADRFDALLSDKMGSGEEMLANSIDAVIHNPEIINVLAHMALDGQGRALARMKLPYIERTIEQIQQQQKDGKIIDNVDAGILLGCGFALGLGWQIFQPLLMVMTGLDKRRRKLIGSDIVDFWEGVIHTQED